MKAACAPGAKWLAAQIGERMRTRGMALGVRGDIRRNRPVCFKRGSQVTILEMSPDGLMARVRFTPRCIGDPARYGWLRYADLEPDEEYTEQTVTFELAERMRIAHRYYARFINPCDLSNVRRLPSGLIAVEGPLTFQFYTPDGVYVSPACVTEEQIAEAVAAFEEEAYA